MIRDSQLRNHVQHLSGAVTAQHVANGSFSAVGELAHVLWGRVVPVFRTLHKKTTHCRVYQRLAHNNARGTRRNRQDGARYFGAVLGFALLAAAQPQSANIPDTPVGHTLKEWLDAFNSGDRATEEKCLKTYDPERSLDDEMRFRGMTGGFILTQILNSDPQRIEFMVKERNSDTVAIGKMEVKPGEPAKVAMFGLRAVPPGTKAADLSFKIDAATRAKVIEGAVAALNDTYVFPEIAQKMEEGVRAHQQKGDYDAISDGDDFAKRLTDDLQATSHDRHLHVMFSPAALPD